MERGNGKEWELGEASEGDVPAARAFSIIV
jgi:hypothetical protein